METDKPIRSRRRIRRFIFWWFKLLVTLVVLSELIAVAFTWITPPRTAFMLEDGEPIAYQFVSIDHISRFVLAAAIVHEDEQLGTRSGAFDMKDFNARVDAYLNGKPDPSGSTIPQQLVKNIFLWPDQNALRKALEAGLSTEFSYTLSKQRIMELYLNYAQFGPKLYGICAASWYYFDEAPWYMSEYQAAQLMGTLPLPSLVQRAKGGGFLLDNTAQSGWAINYINGAANVWVPMQIKDMGGWQAVVATIGITDKASDHAATQNQPDACSTMPQSVSDQLN
ncbi:monofunctional biosynthetic peptidoglycan transglycosylase [Arthrobacter sp. Hiyo8]|uniref:biosynthetic peptidoglycan transglycosylase n=1 Tax=Arthrobacter sp. Hiyo1 TaxID=1588020 RepID=UPI000683A198|nr:biosynthetic peptidoglycan transglycosylase [Arthrobacter sp. Hiyo1]BAS17612.1 monofunctional biosynthetic peptidoglycan transglycosylase [Arthrobacter sp. Hiyo8]GAP57971.1 monofunctional biosynthetic peptidoglycan transglycosylase [Arthrobacter sp. Hiyo1]